METLIITIGWQIMVLILIISNLTKRAIVHNKRFAKVAVQCAADKFVVNQSSVLYINICDENHHLRQAANRKLHP